MNIVTHKSVHSMTSSRLD